jgi:hypothetical protein
MNLLKEPYEMMVHTVATGKKRTQTRYQQVNDRDDWGQRTISHTKSRQEDLDWAVASAISWRGRNRSAPFGTLGSGCQNGINYLCFLNQRKIGGNDE